jgi:hypothetical protein
LARVAKFAEGVGSDPSGLFRRLCGYPLSAPDRGCVKCGIPFADLPQCPVDSFLDHVTVIRCVLFDDRKKLKETLPIDVFVVNSQERHQRKCRPLHKLWFTIGPLKSFLICQRRPSEKVTAGAVHGRPVIKIRRPLVHLPFGNFRWLIDKTGEHASFVYSGAPQLVGKLMAVLALVFYFPGDLFEGWCGDPEHFS